jgi:hypothetical protein
VVLALAFTSASVLLGAHQRHQLAFGPKDEQAHYDYVVDLSHGHVPAWGDRYSQPTVRALSCFASTARTPSACRVARRNPRLYPPDGYSYEAQQPPLAYLPYLLFVEPNAPPRQAVPSARWGGTVWTIIAAGLLVAVGWVEGLSLLELTVLLSICIISPIAVYASATVTNDSAAVASGALALLTWTVARRRGRRMAVTGLVVGIALGLLKGFFLVAPLVLLIAGLLEERGRPEGWTWSGLWRRQACSLCMVVGAGASYVGWVLVQDGRALVPSSVVLHALLVGTVSVRPQWSTVFQAFQNQFSLLIPLASAPLYWVWNLAVYGMFAAIIFLRERGQKAARWRSLAMATFAGIGLFVLGYTLIFTLEGHYNLAPGARFSLPVLPIIALVVVRSLRRSGLLTIGILLPGSAAAAQLLAGRL